MIPTDNITIENTETTTPTTSWEINYDTKRLTFSNNNKALMKQSIMIRLQIERMAYSIYSSNAGMQTTDLPGEQLGVIISDLKRRIKDCVMCDDRVLGIENFKYKLLDKESILITFTANTIYDKIEITKEWTI